MMRVYAENELMQKRCLTRFMLLMTAKLERFLVLQKQKGSQILYAKNRFVLWDSNEFAGLSVLLYL